ncbi:MAG: translation initiation factor IF-2 [DPANN group archaeon]|nr:translation initiation factor IF-2 [DPANN group archaeon]
MLRQPIVTVVGHIDHGKTSLLDNIRRTALIAAEAGGITQCISCSAVPLPTIKKICGPMLSSLKMDFTVPGLLFIDTPGHAAFNNLRKRGGNLADIAILVVDVNEGFMPQSLESIEVLKSYRTPFIVAANKIDLVPGFRAEGNDVLPAIKSQPDAVRQEIDRRIYGLVGSLHEKGFPSERFDRVSDYTKEIAIVPLSAKTGMGINSLLMVLMGLAQRFLESDLVYDAHGPARGTVLEVKEQKGLGITMDAIIYDGRLAVNDTLIIGGPDRPIRTKVRALFEPSPEKDITDRKANFSSVREVYAATGVRISAPDIDQVISGVPLRVAPPGKEEEIERSIKKEVDEVMIETEHQGIVVKADSLGSLEALVNILRGKGFHIKRASVGNISKKDINEASASLEHHPEDAVILGFNSFLEHDVDPGMVKVISDSIIYKLVESLEAFLSEQKKRRAAEGLDNLVRPCKIEVLRGYVFRQNNPAVCGVEVLAGTLRTNTPLMKDGKRLTRVKSMQLEKETVQKAGRGKQLAVSLPDVTIGRQIQEGDILLSAIPAEDFKRLKAFKDVLSVEEKGVMREIAAMMRKSNPVWGI